MFDLFQLIYPACPACGSEEFPGLHGTLCPDCLQKIRFFDPGIRCPGCGGENSGTAELCPQCLAEPPRPWAGAVSVFAYQSFGRELIRRFKFANSPEFARPLGILAAETLKDAGIHADLIVPVPLHFLRYLSRSYNQAGLLAQVISQISGIPMCNALKRKFSLRHQAALGRSDRHKGLQNAFSVRRKQTVAGKKIILVDDVFTTGATLSACARQLIDAGAGQIYVLTVARPFAVISKHG